MLFILNSDQETVGVASNSNPHSLPYFDDVHTENLEGVNTYTFSVPADHTESGLIETEGHIILRNLDGENLLFTIKEAKEFVQSGKRVLEVFCEETAVGELLTDVMRPQSFNSVTLETVAKTVLSNSMGWVLDQVPYTESKDIVFEDYSTILEALYKLAEEYGKEIYFTVELVGTRINKKQVHIVDQRGSETLVRFDYGYDLQGVIRTENTSNVVTALIGVGKGDSTKTRINLTSASAFNDGDYYKEAGTDWIGSDSALQRFGRNGRHRFAVYVNDKATTVAELKQSTIQELKRRSQPELHYACDVITLERLTGYEGKRVRIGDTVVVNDKTFTPYLVVQGRVVSLERSYTRTDQDKVDLGNYKPVTLSENKAIKDLQKAISLSEEKWNSAGKAYYTWIKYADSVTGEGLSDNPDGKRFLGIAHNKETNVESTNPVDYTWSPLFLDVEIGGRNFLKNSAFVNLYNSDSITTKHEAVYAVDWDGFNSGVANANSSYHAHIDTLTFGYPVYEYNESEGVRNWKGIVNDVSGRITETGEYRLSLDAFATQVGGKLFGGFYYTKVGETTAGFHSGQFEIKDTLPINKWGRVDVKVMLGTEVDTSKAIMFYIYGYGFTTNAIVYMKRPKLEKGTVATDWTTSPEDVEEDFAKVIGQLTEISESVTPAKIVETVVFSEDFTSILSDKADVESLNGMATGEELKEVEENAIKYVDGRIDGEGGINEAINAVTSNLERTANAINAKFTSSGGINLIRNSIGYADFDFWTKSGTVKSVRNMELEQLGFGSGFVSEIGSSGYIEQEVILSPRNADGTPKTHSLSFWLNKKADNATTGNAGVEVYAGGVKLAFIGKANGAGTTQGYELGLYSFVTPEPKVTIRLTFGTGTEAVISGLMLNVGEDALQWQHANGELYNTNIQMNLNGIKVLNGQTNGYTIMSPSEFSGYAEVINDSNQREMKKIFTLNGDTTEVTKLDVDLEIAMATVKMIPINTASSKGWAFIADI